MPGSHNGFTLVEMLITIAVLAILAVIAAPSFNDAVERARLKGAADEIVNLANEARQSALKLNRDVTLTVRGSGTSWCAGARQGADPAVGAPLPAATACDCSGTPAGCVVEGREAFVASTSTAPAGQIPAIDAADIAVVFDRKFGTLQDIGQAAATRNVLLTSPTARYEVQVEIAPLGHARGCIPAGKPTLGGYQSC